jgi:Tol biopolymer transport system component
MRGRIAIPAPFPYNPFMTRANATILGRGRASAPRAGRLSWKAALAVAVPAALLLAVLGGLGSGRDAGAPALPAAGAAPGAAVRPGAGTIIFQSRSGGAWQLFALDLASGVRTRLTRSQADDLHPNVSPDGAWIAFGSMRSGTAAIWRMPRDGGAAERLSPDAGECYDPCWTADGSDVLYTSRRGGREQIVRLDLNTRRERPLTSGFWRNILPSASPDGAAVAFARNKLGWDVYRMDSDGANVRALTGKGGNCRPDWSPDGRRIAYVSDVADGKGDVWTMAPDGGDKRRITPGDDSYDYNPTWSPDSRWLVYETTTGSKRNRWSLAVIPAQGGTPLLLSPAGADDRYPDWAPERKQP